ncbi:MAG: hypothetical protein E7277_08690 [Lachnospiraceae bacterium]|jgi:flagellin|nr:hypothetical protein [Lachnospiraceae bacterium]
MIIQHNLLSMNANRNLGISNNKKSKSSEKLASGFNINRAADDAAGLKISEKMRSQIRGLNQATENVDTAISYVKVADGALSEVTDLLQRIRELSVQASNVAVNNIEDRQAIQDEISQLRNEIERIFNDTEFNKKRIWRQPINPVDPVQIGTTRQPAITLSATSETSRNIINNTNRDAMAPQSNLYTLTADENGIVVSWTGYNGKNYTSDLIPYPNDDPLQPLNVDLDNYVNKTTYPELSTGIHMTIAYSVNNIATKEEVIDAINHIGMHSSVNSYELIQLYDENGNTSIPGVGAAVDINYEAELTWDRDMEQGDTTFMQGSLTNMHIPTDDSDTWNLTFTMKNNDGTTSTVTTNPPTITYWSTDLTPSGEGTWWHWSNPNYPPVHQIRDTYSPGTTQGAFRSAVNATGGPNIFDSATKTGFIQMDFRIPNIGNVTITTAVGPSDTEQTVLDRIRKVHGADVYNSENQNQDGGAISNSSFGNWKTLNYNNVEVPIFSSEHEDYISLNIQSGANPYQAVELKYRYLDNATIGIQHMEVDTYEHSQETLAAADKALTIVLGERSRFGAYQNRFEHICAINCISAENAQSAESLIRDTDMDSEMDQFSKEKILENASMSMLAQANQQSARVLQLLQ